VEDKYLLENILFGILYSTGVKSQRW